ncbi:MAG: cation:proton antiporter [Gaiellales bacterium]
MELTLTGLFYVFAVAMLAPLALSFVPWLPLPAVVLEILLGVAIGPLALGLVPRTDSVIHVMALLGVSLLLFIAGLELDLRAVINPRIKTLALGFVVSLALALLVGELVRTLGMDVTPLFLMVVLTATGLGVLLPIMKDAGYLETELGQVIFGACAIAEVIPLVLLSLFFPPAGATQLEHGGRIIILLAVATIAGFALLRGGKKGFFDGRFRRLEDTTAQIRVRGAFLLILGLAALATHFQLEVILAAFAAGLVLGSSRKEALEHGGHLKKLEGAAFGIFIPVFFVSTGINLDVSLLFSSPRVIYLVPIFLVALLVVRGVPTLLYYRLMTRGERVGTAFFQATSLSLLIAATPAGMAAHAITERGATALIAAGMLSVIIYPAIGKAVLRRGTTDMADGLHTPAGQDQLL